MSTNDNPVSGVAPTGLGNDPLTTTATTTTNQPPSSSSDPVDAANASAQPQNLQQNSENAVAAETDGGKSSAPTPDTTTNNTTVAPSTNPTQTAPEEPKESSESSDAHAKEAEDPKGEQEDGEEQEEDTGPSLVITLLLTSGSRHPFKIDGKYLCKQSIKVENNDPFAMSVYTLKELIWREWRPDWESRPSSPSSIRLISFGKLLEDKAPLSDSRFNHDAPNVVHMTVKPQEIVDEEDAKGAKSQCTRERDPSVRSPGCRCVIL